MFIFVVMNYELITIIGPTASGKTKLACALALETNAEIISGDSRQVYKSMDIGTGKDLNDYIIDGKQIPYHLIDIRNAGEKYNIFEYQHDFHRALTDIKRKDKNVILCGGSGLYIESVLKGYSLENVPENKSLRDALSGKTLRELVGMLKELKTLHNSTDIDTAQRTIRAIEIAQYSIDHPTERNQYPPINSLIIGVDIQRDLRRKKISDRLKTRLDEGMIEEIKSILNSGILPEDLIYYGLEYKFVTLYVQGKLTYEEMFAQLEIAIHQFAKRQMTWFRGMEKRGLKITWISATLPQEEQLEIIQNLL